MKLPATAHTTHPWRIHQIAPDFRVEDVWALPTPGGPDDFHRLIANFASLSFPDGAPLIVRALWAARWRLGTWFGWDEPSTGTAARVDSLRDRLPADMSATPRPDLGDDHPFASVYLTGNEYAAELANKTVHTILHLSWVPDGAGGHRGQMAALVKPNGALGSVYMAAIKPIRYLIVYPALLRAFQRDWSAPGSPSP
ncbi:DUF2867 domain-containing protein [Phytoactinopolyspora limicola]|uniref:DUF2867 domain-containing protein n=1 Tax=Phytoactinopolyspora limicola TaxID=2715536 RepID=UPI00140DE9F8|nr:DUF2867 domain-containing protein [Phytoactinopolyspora limicola]